MEQLACPQGPHLYEMQERGNYCGPACVAMVAKKVSDWDYSQKEIYSFYEALPGSPKGKGMPSEYMESVLQKLIGLRTKLQLNVWGTLGTVIRTPPAGYREFPILALGYAETESRSVLHWVVIDGRASKIGTDQFCILDPQAHVKHLQFAIPKAGAVAYNGEYGARRTRATVKLGYAIIHVQG